MTGVQPLLNIKISSCYQLMKGTFLWLKSQLRERPESAVKISGYSFYSVGVEMVELSFSSDLYVEASCV